ncbi:HsdM family class I SAM-dependent methyltransferase [Candidatus Magnetobacterium casense]|uniref:HsdM family class I SAM-dependent methyltransferase n=1 Tax=Candidatus Magnetobacterium casense TaxID=1455061 RepID=UPI00058B7170|nr:N-6 DNA methylase [Candidatus Magnetobacterium casensis]
MADFKSNEREFTGQVVLWLNESLGEEGYPFEVVSSEASLRDAEDSTLFPDVIVWLNRQSQQGFCGWELKTPSTAVDDRELLENAARKARAIHADYFVTWNMVEAIIWRTPLYPDQMSREHRLKTYAPITVVTTPDDLWVESKRLLLRAKAKEILNDLATLSREGHLHLIDVDSTYFVYELSKAVETLRPLMHRSLITELGKSTAFREGLFDWAVKQGIAAYDAGDVFFETVSRQIVYRLLGKILFYLTLYRFRSDIPRFDLRADESTRIDSKLREYFEIARRIDYQAVFEEDFSDKVPFPQDGAETLINLVTDLNRYNFSRMPQDVVGNVFERLIPPQERHTLGQYFTNEALVDLITAFCVRSVTDRVLDPTCGTGTFLIRAYDRLRNFGERDHRRLLSQIWGVDIARFPAELATINLYRQRIEDYTNFPRVISRDFFEIKTGAILRFPPPRPTIGDDFMIDEAIPTFDAIVGNFPYIRQELIEKRIPDYKDTIGNVLKIEYPELFNNGGIRLSGQADIYAYLFFHAASHLSNNGRMGIVTSNSWLDVAYGYELQRFFLKRFKIVAIVESRCESWFEDAAVNTVFTILQRCENENDRNDNNVKFVKLKKRLKELIHWDINNPTDRWWGLNWLTHMIERVGSEYYKLHEQRIVNTLEGHVTFENDNFSIRIIRQKELSDGVESSGKTVKWGQYLRAPGVYFEILQRCADKLVALKEVANVTRGITTNNVKFFYFKKDIIDHWSLEKNYVVGPIIYTPKEVPDILIDTSLLKRYLFVCNEERKRLAGTSALKYIKAGELKRYDASLTFKSRDDWYGIGEINEEPCCLYYARQDVSYRVIFNPDGIIANDNLYRITPRDKDNNKLLCGVLNSTLFYLEIEINGRINLGDGALKIQVYEVEILPILDISNISNNMKESILKAFEKLISRPVKSIFEEVKLRDRQALDSAVLEALGLDPKVYLKPLYDGLTGMVRERIELAKSRKRSKQARTTRDVESLKEQVIEEVIPYGLKRFPEGFVDPKDLKGVREISVDKGPLRLGSYFMGQQEVVSEGGFRYVAASLHEARFIVYAHRPNSFIIRIPKEPLVIAKAVDDYERYLTDLKARLFSAFLVRTHDHKQSEALVQQMFQRLGL